MNDFKKFIDSEYTKALDLNEQFKLLDNKDWQSLTVLLELNIQIGHIYNVLNHDTEIIEEKRIINNMGDELSDVLFQLCTLTDLEGISLEDATKYVDYDYGKLDGLSIILGQLTESLLEKYGYRFTKERYGFKTIDEFIKDRIIKMFLIILNIATQYKLNMIEEFEKMYEDATAFINRRCNNCENNDQSKNINLLKLVWSPN